MSAHHDQEPDSSVGKGITFLFMFGFVFSLVAMLGIVGFYFLKGRPTPESEKRAAENLALVEEAARKTNPAQASQSATPANTSATPANSAAASDQADSSDPAPAAGGTDPSPEQMALGKATYAMCAACHGPDGTGLKAGPALMAPSMVGSDVLLGDPDRPLLVVLKGIAKEDMKFMGQMLPLAAGLDDEKIAAVLTYVRNSWGNSAPAVTVAQAAAAREKFSKIDAPLGVKRGEIESIIKAHK